MAGAPTDLLERVPLFSDLEHKELEQIGPGIQTLPWGYLGAPLAAYQGVRESVGLK